MSQRRRNAGAIVGAICATLIFAPGGNCLAAHALKPAEPSPAGGLAEMPTDRSVVATLNANQKTISYTATVGSLPVRNESGQIIGTVVFTAYASGNGNPADRPVTFLFNGGPGAPAAYLNFGAAGPKRLQFGDRQDSLSDVPKLSDNPASWLDMTDLVFIDPIGTGFSRSLIGKEDSDRQFFNVDADVKYLSNFIYDWLQKNGRMQSPKFLAGESYGGIRTPRMVFYMQTELGIGFRGLILVSPVLDFISLAADDHVSPLPTASRLPIIAAANFERRGITVTKELMADVEHYASGEYITDLMHSETDPAALDRIIYNVAHFTGLAEDVVRRFGGRLDHDAALREPLRTDRKLLSGLDLGISGDDPFPYASSKPGVDPLFKISVVAEAASDYMTRTIGWKYDGEYYSAREIEWNGGAPLLVESGTALQKAMALDPKLRVFIAHGFLDYTAPYLATKFVVDQIPVPNSRARITIKRYPGGHQFYNRIDSAIAFHSELASMYEH